MFAAFKNFALRSLKILDNKYVAGFLRIFLILYAGLIAPKLPANLIEIFQNPIFKVVILFLIVYIGMKDPTVALLVAIGFTISMVTLNKLETVNSLGGLLDAAIDSPQEVANEMIDGSQDLLDRAGGKIQRISGPLSPAVAGAKDLVQGSIDMGQDVANKLVDTVQDAVGSFSGAVGGYVDQAVGAAF